MRRRLTTAVVAIAAMVVGATPVATDAAATFQLPAAPAVGQSATVALKVDSQIAGAVTSGPLSLDVGVARQVAAVDSSTGSFSTRSVIADVALGQVPVGLDVSVLESTRSLSILQQFDATGQALGPSQAENSASPEQADRGRHVLDLMAATTIGYPSEPVAVGASWVSAGAAADTSGLSIPVEYQCRLVAVEGATFTIEVSFAQAFSTVDPLYGQVTGTISGQGRLQGSLDNVLVMNGTMSQTVDGIATIDGAAAPLGLTSTIQIASG